VKLIEDTKGLRTFDKTQGFLNHSKT